LNPSFSSAAIFTPELSGFTTAVDPIVAEKIGGTATSRVKIEFKIRSSDERKDNFFFGWSCSDLLLRVSAPKGDSYEATH
jgi:hypothetical protein